MTVGNIASLVTKLRIIDGTGKVSTIVLCVCVRVCAVCAHVCMCDDCE